MIRRKNRIELLKLKLDSFKKYEGTFKYRELFFEAMDNIEAEVNSQKERIMKVEGII